MVDLAPSVRVSQLLVSIGEAVLELKDVLDANEYPDALVKPNLKEADDALWGLIDLLNDDEAIEDFIQNSVD